MGGGYIYPITLFGTATGLDVRRRRWRRYKPVAFGLTRPTTDGRPVPVTNGGESRQICLVVDCPRRRATFFDQSRLDR